MTGFYSVVGSNEMSEKQMVLSLLEVPWKEMWFSVLPSQYAFMRFHWSMCIDYIDIYIYIWSVSFSVLLIPILAFERAMRGPPTACFDSSARKPYRSAVDTKYQSMGLQKGCNALQENVDKNCNYIVEIIIQKYSMYGIYIYIIFTYKTGWFLGQMVVNIPYIEHMGYRLGFNARK